MNIKQKRMRARLLSFLGGVAGLGITLIGFNYDSVTVITLGIILFLMSWILMESVN